MADQFLTKTRVDRSQLIETQEGPALERHAILRDILDREAGPDAAGLFAEPIIGRPDDSGRIAVSWYTDFMGEPRRLSDLDGPTRSDVEARLSARLQDIKRLMQSADLGPSMGAMLTIPDPGSIWVVGGQPVIADWGVAAPGATTTDDARNTHYARTLGRYLPLANPVASFAGRDDTTDPPMAESPPTGALDPTAATNTAAPASTNAAPAQAAAIPVTATGPTTTGRDSQPPPPPGPMDVDRSRGTGGRAAIWTPVLLILLFAALLVWLLLPETRLFPPRLTAIETQIDDRAESLARETNRALAERAEALEAALRDASCTDSGELLLPDGRTREGLLPPPPRTADDPSDRAAIAPREGVPTPLIPPDPERVRVPDPDGPDSETAQDAPSLLQTIESRTVLVLAANGDGTGIGTGFFVAPDLVATNHHVIAGALPGGTVYVTNRSFGAVREAEVLATDGPFEDTGGDFALLRIPGADAPFFPLLAGGVELRAQGVIAAGFPTDILQSDRRYRSLLSGDGEAVPDMIVTDGIVNTVQQVADGIDMVVHSAPISKGNSGGPLVDMCGRVVGMNTFVREEAFRNLNLAQANRSMLNFLRTAGSEASVTDAPCVPRVAPAVPRAATIPDAAETETEATPPE